MRIQIKVFVILNSLLQFVFVFFTDKFPLSLFPLCCPRSIFTEKRGKNLSCPLDTADSNTSKICEIGKWERKSMQTNIGFMPFELIDQTTNYCIGPSLPVPTATDKSKNTLWYQS